MNKIMFSHLYQKLLDSHNDCVETATLLQVVPINLKDLSKEFIAYDTDNGVYKLPPKGQYMMLIFLKPHEHYITDLNLFTTLRRWTPEKYRYYTEQVGKVFNVSIIPEEGKESGDDHAFVCECGSVHFALLRSNVIECSSCQSRFGCWSALTKKIRQRGRKK